MHFCGFSHHCFPLGCNFPPARYLSSILTLLLLPVFPRTWCMYMYTSEMIYHHGASLSEQHTADIIMGRAYWFSTNVHVYYLSPPRHPSPVPSSFPFSYMHVFTFPDLPLYRSPFPSLFPSLFLIFLYFSCLFTSLFYVNVYHPPPPLPPSECSGAGKGSRLYSKRRGHPTDSCWEGTC